MERMRKKKRERKITAHDRMVDRKNALRGTEKWRSQSPSLRRMERMRATHGWGFEGRSPNTKSRKYTKKKSRSYF